MQSAITDMGLHVSAPATKWPGIEGLTLRPTTRAAYPAGRAMMAPLRREVSMSVSRACSKCAPAAEVYAQK